MRGRRLIAILIGVIGIALFAIVAIVLFLQSQEGDPAPPQVGADGVSTIDPNITPSPTVDPVARMVEVVVSLQTVQRGFQMTENELTTDMRLASEVGSNVITRIEDAVGLYARTDIYQGETLTTDSLVRDPTLIGQEEYGPASLIPPGWEAIGVPMDRLSSVGYALAPGDSVDVMLSFSLSAIDEEFQTLLANSITFFIQTTSTGEDGGAAGQTIPGLLIIDPYGRFEQLPTGDVAMIGPSEESQRPVPISVILQNARVIQVGTYEQPVVAQPPTPTPDPNEPTPTPDPNAVPTPTPSLPDVVVVALPPQQLLFLKYGVETFADIDFAIRAANDGQLYTVQNVDLNYLLTQFDITIPPNFDYTIGGFITTTLEIQETTELDEGGG
jgi:Flp pilus assembly protein CpaB